MIFLIHSFLYICSWNSFKWKFLVWISQLPWNKFMWEPREMLLAFDLPIFMLKHPSHFKRWLVSFLILWFLYIRFMISCSLGTSCMLDKYSTTELHPQPKRFPFPLQLLFPSLFFPLSPLSFLAPERGHKIKILYLMSIFFLCVLRP
jgi:hypothetical protein